MNGVVRASPTTFPAEVAGPVEVSDDGLGGARSASRPSSERMKWPGQLRSGHGVLARRDEGVGAIGILVLPGPSSFHAFLPNGAYCGIAAVAPASLAARSPRARGPAQDRRVSPCASANSTPARRRVLRPCRPPRAGRHRPLPQLLPGRGRGGSSYSPAFRRLQHLTGHTEHKVRRPQQARHSFSPACDALRPAAGHHGVRGHPYTSGARHDQETA